jgi:hypothetical protein
MTLTSYTSLWNLVRAPMLAALTRLRDELENTPGLGDTFAFAQVTPETDAEEFFASLLILDRRNGDDHPVIAIDFTLCDEAEVCAGANGSNVRLTVDLVQEQTTEWTYCPQNYTAECFTNDSAELLRRIQDLPHDVLLAATQGLLHKLTEATPA